MRRSLFFMIVMLLALIPASAWAKETDAAAAELLFQKGREALFAEDFETACPLFEESLKLDPAVGTVMNLAACEEKRGHLTASWERWHQALRLLEEGDSRVKFAAQQLHSVEERLAHLTINLAEDAPSGLTVRRDGIVLGKASLGQELPADPGAHVVTVESRRYETKSYSLSLESGEHAELVVTAGKAKPEEQIATGGRGEKVRKIGGFAALGVGALGVGTAIVTGVMLPAQDRKVEENCPNKVCNSAGTDAKSTAQTLVALNTAGWIAAGVGLATGTVLLLTLPRKPPAGHAKKKSRAAPQENSAGRPGSAFEPRGSMTLALMGTGLQLLGEF